METPASFVCGHGGADFAELGDFLRGLGEAIRNAQGFPKDLSRHLPWAMAVVVKTVLGSHFGCFRCTHLSLFSGDSGHSPGGLAFDHRRFEKKKSHRLSPRPRLGNPWAVACSVPRSRKGSPKAPFSTGGGFDLSS